jgi:hypothetical protein
MKDLQYSFLVNELFLFSDKASAPRPHMAYPASQFTSR